MDCKITFSKPQRVLASWATSGRGRRQAGAPAQGTAGVTLVELLITLSIGCLVLAAVCAFAVFSSRSIASFVISSDLDQKNRQTLDQLVMDVRMANSVSSFSSNSVTLDGTNTISYTYDPAKDTLTRVQGANSSLLLTNCGRFMFSMYMRNMTNGTFDFCPTTNLFECKAITVDWCCQRKILGMSSDDLPQTATIVIRN